MSSSLKKMSKLNNKLTNSFNSKINSCTKNYNKLFTKNDYVNHGVSLLIVVLILCIQLIPNNVLSFFVYTSFECQLLFIMYKWTFWNDLQKNLFLKNRHRFLFRGLLL